MHGSFFCEWANHHLFKVSCKYQIGKHLLFKPSQKEGEKGFVFILGMYLYILKLRVIHKPRGLWTDFRTFLKPLFHLWTILLNMDIWKPPPPTPAMSTWFINDSLWILK